MDNNIGTRDDNGTENEKSHTRRLTFENSTLNKLKLYIHHFNGKFTPGQIEQLFKPYGFSNIMWDKKNKIWCIISFPDTESAERALKEVREAHGWNLGVQYFRDKKEDTNELLEKTLPSMNFSILSDNKNENVNPQKDRKSLGNSNGMIVGKLIPKCANKNCIEPTLDECMQCHASFCSKTCMVHGYKFHKGNCILLPPHSSGTKNSPSFSNLAINGDDFDDSITERNYNGDVMKDHKHQSLSNNSQFDVKANRSRDQSNKVSHQPLYGLKQKNNNQNRVSMKNTKNYFELVKPSGKGNENENGTDEYEKNKNKHNLISVNGNAVDDLTVGKSVSMVTSSPKIDKPVEREPVNDEALRSCAMFNSRFQKCDITPASYRTEAALPKPTINEGSHRVKFSLPEFQASNLAELGTNDSSSTKLRLKLGESVKVFVTSKDNNAFYIANHEELKMMMEMTSKLNIHQCSTGEFKKDMKCLARYADDNEWYRAIVIDENEKRLLVRYLDFGNIELAEKGSLRKIPESLENIPPLAIKVKLDDTDSSVEAETIQVLVPVLWDITDEMWIVTIKETVRIQVMLALPIEPRDEFGWVIPTKYRKLQRDIVLLPNIPLKPSDFHVGLICLFPLLENMKTRVQVISSQPPIVKYLDTVPYQVEDPECLLELPEEYKTWPPMVMKVIWKTRPIQILDNCSQFDIVRDKNEISWTVENVMF